MRKRDLERLWRSVLLFIRAVDWWSFGFVNETGVDECVELVRWVVLGPGVPAYRLPRNTFDHLTAQNENCKLSVEVEICCDRKSGFEIEPD